MITVSVGIAAYNEENSIIQLLDSLLIQNESGINLDKIIVASDGSSDKTEHLVRNYSDTRVVLLADGKRKGKNTRVNEIFDFCDSDILVLLDADIVISSANLISDLVKPLLDNSSIFLTSGKITPLPPVTFTQRVVYAGTELWEEAKKLAPYSDMYYCSGAVRALRKELYSVMKFPKVRAEDIYPYLYCNKHGYGFEYVGSAEILYGLPATFSDYVKQMKRYLRSSSEHSQLFDSSFVKKNFTITPFIKLKALWNRILIDPFYTCLYFIYLITPKILVRFEHVEYRGYWDVISSSKKIPTKA